MNLFLKKCVHYFGVAAILSCFINTLYLTFPLYMLATYTRVLSGYSMSTLASLTILALSALLVLTLLTFVRSRLLVQAGVRMDRLMSRPVLKTMLAELSQVGSSGYNRGLQDVNLLRNYFGGNAIFAFFDVPWIFIYLWIIFLVHPVLGLTASGGGLVLLIVGIVQTLATRTDDERINEVNGMTQNFQAKCFRASQALRTMGMLGHGADHWNRIYGQGEKNRIRSENLSHALDAVSSSFRAMMQVIIFGAGALLVVLDKADAGVIIAASIIMGRALAPITQGIAAWRQTSGAVAAYGRLKRLMATPVSKEPVDTERLQGDLEVTDLGLHMEGAPVSILSDVSFRLEKGEILGLVGPNGAGKTCLCRMILGMWQPTAGEVLLGGRNVYDLDQDMLGSFIGYLPQNVELFPGTVGQNIARLGELDSEAVVAAASMAGAHDTILRFSQGYETDIGEAGASLSGGQRQRVGLARALYGNPGLVVLDEPNSNLDNAGEAALVRALQQLSQKGITTIMITHKPDLLYHVDKILVLKQGRVSAFGSRNEVFSSIAGGGAPSPGAGGSSGGVG